MVILTISINIYIYIYTLYFWSTPGAVTVSTSQGHKNEHQPNAENKGLIWWYDTDKFLYQNQKNDQVDTMNM